jgi:hypothetical protein
MDHFTSYEAEQDWWDMVNWRAEISSLLRQTEPRMRGM